MAVDRRLSLIADGFYPGSERYQTLTDGFLDDRPQEPWFKHSKGSATWTTIAESATSWSGSTSTAATWTTAVPKTPLGNPRIPSG